MQDSRSRSASTFFAVLVASALAGPLPAQAADGEARGTIQLLVEGTIDRVRVTSAWARAFAYRDVARRGDPTGWVRLFDASGAELAKVHFDLSTVNRDRGARKGQEIVFGDMLLEGEVTRLVKIPDFGDRLSHLRFESVEKDRVVQLGRVTRVELERIATTTAHTRPLGLMPTVRTHINNGKVGNRYDIVVLGDAYRAGDEAKFVSDVNRWTANLFAKEPFKSYSKFFNVHSVFRASNQDLADKPGPCTNPPVVRDTVYDTSYCVGGTDRCLYIRNTSLASQDAALAPDVEGRIVVFVNDSKYGGCASTFAVSYNGSSGSEVQTHEFGHSFAGLADEYSYGRSGTYSGSEPRQANITADSTCAKWQPWIGTNGVGCFQGAGYYQTGLWRPKNNCLMRSLGVALCEVCKEECTLDCYNAVDPIEDPQPSTASVTVDMPATQAFSFTNLVPPASNASVEWYVDNTRRQTGGSSFSFASASYGIGSHTVRVDVLDRTAMVRKDPTNRRAHSYTWSVLVRDPSKIGTFTTYGAGCSGSGADYQVLPASLASAMGDTVNSAPFGAAQLRYQQILDGAETRSATIDGLALRYGTQSSVQAAGARTVEIFLGASTYTPATLTANFDGNYASGTKRSVFRGTVNLPLQFGANTDPNVWAVSIPFQAPYVHTQSAGRDLLVEVVNSSTSTLANFLDATSRGNTARVSATSTTATSGTVVRNYGLAMRLRSAARSVVKLDHVGVPTIGRSFQLTLAGAAESSVAVLWMGLNRANVPLPSQLAPGCSLYATLEILPLATQLTDPSGFASVVFPVPNDPGLVGARFFNEWFVLDAGANPLGMSFTNGGEGKVGSQ